jgi:molybdopterin-guanine dinucleotide biosynthesis protein A
MALAAIILAGGKATRLGGVDKALIEVDGRPLLGRSIDAVPGASPIVVVGPPREIEAAVHWVREDPPGSGPLAALAAGVVALQLPGETHVAVLAGDLLGIGPSTVPRLRSTLDNHPDAAGAVLVDDEGFPQWMHGVWRLGALRDAVPPDSAGQSLRSVLGALPLVGVRARDGEAADVDTPDDLPPDSR